MPPPRGLPIRGLLGVGREGRVGAVKVERGWLGLEREPPKERGELGEVR